MALYLSNFSQYLQFCGFNKIRRAERIFRQRYWNKSISVFGELASSEHTEIKLRLSECPVGPGKNYNVLINVGVIDPNTFITPPASSAQLPIKITSFDHANMILHAELLSQFDRVDYTISCQEIFSIFIQYPLTNIWKGMPVSLIGCLGPDSFPSIPNSPTRFFVVFPCINNAMNPVFLTFKDTSLHPFITPSWVLIDGYIDNRIVTDGSARHIIAVKNNNLNPINDNCFNHFMENAINIEKSLISPRLCDHVSNLLERLPVLPTLSVPPPAEPPPATFTQYDLVQRQLPFSPPVPSPSRQPDPTPQTPPSNTDLGDLSDLPLEDLQ